jgi:phosphomannomutase
MEPLSFGTDGWRAPIARDFTFANLRRVAGALGRALPARSTVLVGWDHRFLSEDFAAQAAAVLARDGHRVTLCDGPTTSPALSYSLKKAGARAGVMITASHNPPEYNGFKIKLPPGCSADPAFTRRVESLVEPEVYPAPPVELKKFSPAKEYVAYLVSRLDRKIWSGKKITLVADAMNGPGGEIWAALFDRLKLNGEVLRRGRDPLFGGGAPEPVEKYLEPLRAAVAGHKAALGVAVDGDADRLGVVDDTGTYLPPHTVFPLLLWHLVEDRKLTGRVVQSVSLGYISERMAKAYRLPFAEVSVGFKYVAEAMRAGKTLLGGEESGGYGVGLWGLERDGVLMGLLLAEMVMARRKPLSALRREMEEKFGASHFQRTDAPMKLAIPDKAKWAAAVKGHLPPKIGGVAVKECRTGDGAKIVLEDGAWVLLRPSGTEPLLRLYAESPDAARTQQLLTKAQELANSKAVQAVLKPE